MRANGEVLGRCLGGCLSKDWACRLSEDRSARCVRYFGHWSNQARLPGERCKVPPHGSLFGWVTGFICEPVHHIIERVARAFVEAKQMIKKWSDPYFSKIHFGQRGPELRIFKNGNLLHVVLCHDYSTNLFAIGRNPQPRPRRAVLRLLTFNLNRPLPF